MTQYFDDEKEHKAALAFYFEKSALAMALLISGLRETDIQATEELETAYAIREYLDTKYKVNNFTVKLKRQHELNDIVYVNLRSFINNLNDAVSRFRSAGGKTGDWVLTCQIGKLPQQITDKLKISSLKGSDGLLCALRDILSTTVHEEPELSSTTATTSNTTPTTEFMHQLKHGGVLRCTKCNGWRHTVEQCPTKQQCCYRCGSVDHVYSQCPALLKNKPAKQKNKQKKKQQPQQSQQQKLNAVQQQDSTSDDDEFHLNTFTVRQLKHVADTDNDTTDDDTPTNNTTVFLNTVATSNSSAIYSPSTPCSCRFGKDCCKLLMDSGASGSSVKSPYFVDMLLALPRPVTLVSAFKDKLKATEYGPGEFMLENNRNLALERLIVAPQIPTNIISLHDLVQQDYVITISKQFDLVLKIKIT